MNAGQKLPEKFSDLEMFVEKWAKETELERATIRRNSSMAEIKMFYDAILPVTYEALMYLDQFKLNSLPSKENNLFLLCLALVEVGNAVDYYGQPCVKGGAGVAGYDHTILAREKLTFIDDKCLRSSP